MPTNGFPRARRTFELALLAASLTAVGCSGSSEPPVLRRDAAVTRVDDAATTPDQDTGTPPEADAGTDDTTATEPYTGPVEGVLTGLAVQARTGAPLAGVTVTLTGADGSATTDATGTFALDIAPGDYVAHFAKDGFLSVHRRVHIDGWERVFVNVTLMPAAASTPVDGMTGGTVTTGGTSVRVVGASVLDPTGAPTDDVEIAVTPIDPVDDIDSAPGDFVGERDSGEETPIVSYGMVDIQIDTPTGPGTLDPDAPATVEIPIGDLPDGDTPVNVGDCIPLWYFDTDLGTWVEEGEACAEARPDGTLVMVGNVGRPGTWNCDAPVQSFCYTGTVTDCGGLPIPGAEIILTGGSVTSSQSTRSDSEGHYTVTGAARRGAILEAHVLIDGTTYTTQTDFVYGDASACTAAPDLSFPFRYVTAAIQATDLERRTFSGSADRVVSLRTATAQFWDITRGPVPFVLACEGNAPDTLAPLTGSSGGSAPSLDVGNPVTLSDGVNTTDLQRRRMGGTLVNYQPTTGTTVAAGSVFDVDIRGAAGVMPATHLTDALTIPTSLNLTSPASDVERRFSASSIPLRWTPADDGSVLEVTIGSGSTYVTTTLTDDGSADLSVAAFPTLRGVVSISITRSMRRYHRLVTGPQAMVAGVRTVTFDAVIE